jgi:hypothetical protein
VTARLLVAATVAAVVASLVLLALAPRLRWLDDQRRRAVALAVMVLGTLALGLAAVVAVRAEASRLEDDAADELYAALEATSEGEALVLAGEVPLPGGATDAAELQRGGVAFYRPVEVLWVRWCMVAVVDDDKVTVDRVHEPCP